MQGKSVFDYSIIPHAGDWREACQQAYAFQTELRAIETGIHPGEIPAQGSFVSSSPASFIISAVKAAENGKGWIVRGYNIGDDEISVTLTPWRKFKKAERANMAEKQIGKLKVESSGGVTVKARGHEVVTLLFQE